jgi:hypothetical protein
MAGFALKIVRKMASLNPGNPRLFESPMPYMLSPELSVFSTEIVTVIDDVVSSTVRRYLQLLSLIPAGGTGEIFPIYCDITEIAK